MIEAELVLGTGLNPLIVSSDIGLYHYGSENELVKVFSANAVKYPIVWLVMPIEGANTESLYKKELNTTLRVILATSSQKEWFNDRRNEETYKKVLVPLSDKVVKAINDFKFIDITSREVKIQKLHNYHRTDLGTRNDPQKRTALDYWDVIILEFDARIKKIC
jgi:hypothetical protein